ncbi:glycosyltransferase family 4 protein [Sulfurospirillum sp. 1307]
MKIAFIISSLGSGGAERVLTLLANELSKKHEVFILTFSSADPFYELDSKVTHIKLDLLKQSENIFQSIKNSIKRIFVLKKKLKEIKADVNISFMTHTNILSIIASKLNNQKIIVSERTIYDFYNSKMLNILRKIIYPFSNELITQTKSDAQNYNFSNNIKIIYNPINFTNNDNDILYSQKREIILAVGRLDKQKGFDNLIRAYANIKTDWKLYIAGEGKERQNLEKLIELLQLNDKVILLGNQKNIFEWYAKASIFVLSSRKEGFPNVLIEAMSMGCAVVSFDCPYGPGEIIEDGVNGILVGNQNIEKLTKSIQQLIDDESLRKRLSKEAVKVQEKYSIKKIASEWEKVMKKVVNE